MSGPPGPVPRIPLSNYWGIIQAGRTAGYGSSQLWSAVKAGAAAEGFGTPTGGIMEMGRLSSIATGQVRATAALNVLSDSDALTSAHIATDINSRPIDQRNAMPRYAVRVEATVSTLTGLETQWKYIELGNQLPLTKGALMDQLNTILPAMQAATGPPLESYANAVILTL